MSEHKFRYLLPPGTNFAFVSKFKVWLVVTGLLMVGSIAMLFVNKQVRGEYLNWTIDFKGGTEIVLAAKDKGTDEYTKLDLGKARAELEKMDNSVEVTELSFSGETKSGKATTVNGIILRTTRFSALTPELADKIADDVRETFKDREIHKVAWSGDRLSIRSSKPIADTEMLEVFSRHEREGAPWTPEDRQTYSRPDEGTGEYNQWYSIRGLDRQYELALEQAFPDTDVVVMQSYGVGAKAGDKLRNDAIKSVVYAIFLIMLYLAFRFDIRYAPGAAFATIHDAVMVIGVFAVTYTEVSLTSVAGLLTVVGFSVNDTVVVFDRIRENQAKLKDKSMERIVDISLNEVLVRSILTSATVFATTLVMNIFGTGLVENFAFTMNVGVIVGAYSSLFLAAPIFLWINRKWYSGPPRNRRRGAAVSTPSVAKSDAGEV
jgi:preprotein translocase subunit SecF